MTKKPFKVMTSAAIVAAFSASAIVPTAVMAAETPAEALSVTDYIVENDGKFYSIDVETLLDMKAAGITFSVKYVKASNGNVYSLDNYLDAKAAVEGGTMADALTVLEENEDAAADVEYGQVDGVDEDGNPNFVDPEENEELAEAIAAAEAAIAELPEEITLDDKAAVEAARALVDAALALDEDAEIAGLDTLVAAEKTIADLEVSEVTVESVKAINPTTIQVTFSGDLTEEQANKDNFSLSTGTVEAVTVQDKVATISVKGLTYGTETTVTVGSPAHTATVTVPEVSELFVLEVTTDAANDTIKSDGAAKTQVTVTLKDRTTGEVVKEDGIVQFQATRGGLGQTTSALQNGTATVQLTSVASATSMTSIVTATVSDVPGAAEFEGLTAQKAVIFSPDAVDEGKVNFVQAVDAESTQGDRLFVTFSDKIKASDYKAAIKKAKAPAAVTSLDYGIVVDGKTVAVKDVVNKTDNTLEFILDVDSASGTGHKRIESGWAGATAGEKNYLRDNVTHNVAFPSNVGSIVLANQAGINFILTDTSRPAVLGVTAKDQLEFNVRFTESVDERTVENAPQNFLLDGRQVEVIPAPNAGQIAAAKAANRIILTSLKVGEYYFKDDNGVVSATDNGGKAFDERNIVTFKVHKDFALAGGTHQIQIANVSDWAGDVDPTQNIVATDTFDFNVTIDNSIPAPTVEVQSAEQWKVSFDKPVYGTTGSKTIADIFAVKSADANDTFVMGNTPVAGVDYIVSTISADGTTGSVLNPSAPASTIQGQQHFLIEFTNDWTVKYDTNANPTKTYFASSKNPYVVTLDNLESAIGNKVGKKELDVKLSYDGTSPEIASASQIKVNNVLTADVRVKMTEPVKNVVGNNEGNTPSQQQTAGAGVPQPTYEFVKGDKVVKATASNGSYDNYAFTLQPDSTLEAGEWTLYIRSISDDIGNTSATVSQKVTIEATAQAATDTRMAWAAFDDAFGNNTLTDLRKDKDVIYVKFTKQMKSDGANGVSRTQNYVFMGQPLPAGSQVVKGIAGVTNDWDGVTIIMPKDTWNGTNSGNDFTNALNIASNFVSADGEALSGAYEVELTDTATTQSTLATGFEATYLDAGTNTKANQVTFGGAAAVKGAEANDTDNNGKIDEIKLTLDAKHGVIKANTEVNVNGKTFVTPSTDVAANTGLVTLSAKTTNDQIDGTATTGLKITGKDGSIIVNTGLVVDKANPIITNAELNVGKDKLTLTFSEAVTNNNNGTFGKVDVADFAITGGATVTEVAHDESTPNKVVLTITGGANLDASHTITPSNFFDFANNGVDTTAFAPIKGALLAGPAAPAVTGGQTKITGIVAGLEYRLGSTGTFTAVTPAQVTAGEVTGLAAGTYEVRVAQTSTHAAGAVANVQVTP